MHAKYIAPVIAAVQNVFATMITLPVVPGKQSFKKDKRPTTEVISTITLSGTVAGFVCLGLSRNLAFILASRLLDCQIRDASAECIDAIGELTNMIAGNAKSEFPAEGIAISVPEVLFDPSGAAFPLNVPVISIPFQTQGEELLVDMGLLLNPRQSKC
jgi:chemotaxis protein CheX